jgi:peptide/nickel transport system substrate-binding protein
MHSINIPSKENNYRGGNYGAYRNPTNDKLLDLGLKTLNQAERVDIYKRVQYILMEDLPVLPIFLRPVTTAAANNLMNFRPSMSSSGETWNIEQWEKVSQ